jgi:hypothetical protein
MEAILETVEAEQKESEGVGETENESEGVREEGEEGVQTADADGD